MSRVIQDSDDELDDDVEIDFRQPEKKDASPKQSTSDASSTEALRRQIEAAHRSHLQSHFPVNDDHTSAPLDVNHQKRKVPADFDLSSISSATLAAKQVHIDYGRKSKGIFSSSPAGQHEDQNLVNQVLQPIGATNGSDWMLEGTMRDEYAQHNPNEMFPEPSSTVPNATLTQQRVLDGVLPPALLGSDTDVGGVSFQPDASIPWSEYLKSPTNTGEQSRSSAQGSHVSQNISVAMSQTSPSEQPAHSNLQQSRQSFSMPMGSLSIQETTGAHDVTMFPNDGVQTNATHAQTTSSSTSNDLTQEEPPSSSRQFRKKKPSPEPTSDDDLADFGLLKEQYKPRPSRSRSLKVDTQESIDYSIIPEKAARATRRRRTTPASAVLINPPSTPVKIRQVCDMGFTPSTSEMALRLNSGDVTQTVAWLITNRVADDELVSHTSQLSKASKNQAQVSFDTDTHHDALRVSHIDTKQTAATDIDAAAEVMNHDTASVEMDMNAPVIDPRSSAKVQVLIPTKSPKTTAETSQKKAKRRKTTPDQREPTATENIMNGAKAEGKRGRGRPKKAAKAPVLTDVIQDGDGDRPQEQARGSPLLSVDGNSQIPAQHQAIEQKNTAKSTKTSSILNTPQPEAATTVTATSRSTPEPQVLPNRPEVEPITPERVKKPAPKDQSSSNKSKVPYRVGLSKRARIAPLLRTMKR